MKLIRRFKNKFSSKASSQGLNQIKYGLNKKRLILPNQPFEIYKR
jgi:hypothetical protein